MASIRGNRRQLLTAIGGGAAAAAAAAAFAARPALASAPGAALPTSRQGGTATLLIRDDIRSAYAADAAVAAWGEQTGSAITLDVPPAALDVSQRIQAAQAADDLIWDGFGVIEVPWDVREWVSRGLIQPLDPFIAASQTPRAAEVVPGIIESIRESMKVDGQQYAIPGNVGSVALAWLTEPLREAAIAAPPTTWDEVYQAAKLIKQARPDLTPFDSAVTPLCDLWAMIWGASDQPITAEGLVDITGQASLDALAWMRTMVDEELMPEIRTGPNNPNNENFANWQRGATAIITSYDVAGTIAQQTFGLDAAGTGLNMVREAGAPRAGTPFWVNGCVVLSEAANPQALVDFYLGWFGPDNKATGEQIAAVAAKPCYQYTYDEFVAGKPDRAWQLESIEVVRRSVPFPATTTTDIQSLQTFPWVERVLGPDRLDPREAMEGALADIRAEIEKQQR